MAWERRGSKHYYYKKQREGSLVKSVYVGRGEIAHMIAEIQASSPLLERLARTIESREAVNRKKEEAALEQLMDLSRLITQASLLAAGFHTHKRQWRRKRYVNANSKN